MADGGDLRAPDTGRCTNRMSRDNLVRPAPGTDLDRYVEARREGRR